MKSLFLLLCTFCSLIGSAQLTVRTDSTEAFYPGGFAVVAFQDDELTYIICDDTSLTDHYTKTCYVFDKSHVKENESEDGKSYAVYRCADHPDTITIKLYGVADCEKIVINDHQEITYTGNIDVEILPPQYHSGEKEKTDENFPTMNENNDGKGFGFEEGFGHGDESTNGTYRDKRKVISEPHYSFKWKRSGTIAVDIWVDKKGKVVKTKINNENSDTNDHELIVIAIGLCNKIKFEEKPGSEVEHIGYKVFEFVEE